MKFATVSQIVILAAVSCLGLFTLDYWKNPQLWHTAPVAAAEGPPKGVMLTLWMNHMVCTTCLDDVRQALSAMPALDLANATLPKQLMTQAQADTAPTMADYGNEIVVPVVDMAKLDFAAVDRALRDKGLVAGRMEIGGVEHFRLEAKLNHLCCGACERATTEHIDFLKAKGSSGQFRWLDSVNVDRDKKVVTAYARYLQPGKTVDVNEFLAGLNDTGFAPVSVRALVGEGKATPTAQTGDSDAAAHSHAANAH